MLSSTSTYRVRATMGRLRLSVPSHTRIKSRKPTQSLSVPSCTPIVPSYALLRSRYFSQATNLLARKDTQDKDSMNIEPNEYSKSGSDTESARQEEAAFDPEKTDPQEQKEKAGEGTGEGPGGNPLEVSPANPSVSKQRGSQEGGAENSSGSAGAESDRQRSSGGGSPSKGKKVS